MTDVQIQAFSESQVQCRRCQQVVKPEEELDCGYDLQGLYKVAGQGCPEDVKTKRLTLFDCVFYLQREGKDMQTKIVDAAWVPKSRFQTPDNRPIDEHMKEIAKAPFNFVEFYAAETLDEQAKQLSVPNRFGQQVPQGYQPQQPQGQQPPPQQGYAAPQQGYQQTPPPGYQPQGQPPQQGYQAYQPQQPPQPGYPSVPGPGRPNFGK